MTIVVNIAAMLEAAFPSHPEQDESLTSTARQFIPTKRLSEKDSVLIDMLNTRGHESVCYCVCDPDLPDLPILFSSDGFCEYTGYSRDEIEGKNCRFLQGADTRKEDVDTIRGAIKGKKASSVNLLNYKKDGTPFINEFFISPLYTSEKKLAYFIGVQCSVPKAGRGQMPANAG